MTTIIDELSDENNFINKIDYDNLPETILDLSQNIENRMEALEIYYNKKKNETIEIISRINGMYQMSGINILEDFLIKIAINTKLDILLRLEASKSLLSYKELEDEIEESDSEDEIITKTEENKLIKNRNEKRLNNSSYVLNEICKVSINLPTPCRVEAILLLMEFEKYEKEVNLYFIEMINDQNIECEFRYTTILSLERKSLEYYKEILKEKFDNKCFVKELFTEYLELTKKEFPNFSPNIENYKFFELLITRMNYDFAKKQFNKYTDKKCPYSIFLFNALLEFLKYDINMTYFKVLAGQYLLQKFERNRNEVENILFSIAKNETLDYDRRADAADVLLQLGSQEMKNNGRKIIIELGDIEGRVKTVFDNAQNVHIEEVEESVVEVLEFFSIMPTKMINKQVINFDYVKSQIENLLKECKKIMNENEYKERENKVKIAISRIYLDRALYSKYNSTLSNILIKVWSYLSSHEYEKEMQKRLLEELEEMSGTCSTGFASRLINVISGFGEFNIRISWEDQIIANFSGRINAAARKITDDDSIFYTDKLEDVMKLWINSIEQKELKNDILNKLHTSEYITEQPTTIDIINEYLSENKNSKVNNCIEIFSENVLNEMLLPSSVSHDRLHFSLFFRTYVAYIREEMYQEFKEYLDDTSFDLYMRKAMMRYEGL